MNAILLDRLGKPGVIGVGLLIFCLVFYLGNIAPGQDELNRLSSEITRLQAAALDSRPSAGEQALTSAAGERPAFATATESLKELSALAEQHGLTIERATYLLSNKEGQRRLEVSLPLKAGYPSLRAYLRDLLALPGGPVLDEMQLQRQKASETAIEANLRLSYYFAPAS